MMGLKAIKLLYVDDNVLYGMVNQEQASSIVPKKIKTN